MSPCVQSGTGQEELGMAGQLNGLSRPCSYNTCSFSVCDSDSGLHHQRLQRRVLQCWRDRNSDYGKKDVILNFTLSIPTLSVTKTAVNFCTCAKRCCGVWLSTKSLFTDTGAVEGDVCERIHTKIKITEFSSYRCFCSFSSWWWHSSENGCA